MGVECLCPMHGSIVGAKLGSVVGMSVSGDDVVVTLLPPSHIGVPQILSCAWL